MLCSIGLHIFSQVLSRVVACCATLYVQAWLIKFTPFLHVRDPSRLSSDLLPASESYWVSEYPSLIALTGPQ